MCDTTLKFDLLVSGIVSSLIGEYCEFQGSEESKKKGSLNMAKAIKSKGGSKFNGALSLG